MAKEMIISSNGFERRIAIIEDGTLSEFYVERVGEDGGIVGNIYKGRVTKVLPGMQSAFVEIGLERDAFLYVSDVTEESDVEFDLPGTPAPAAVPPPRSRAAAPPDNLIDAEVEDFLQSVRESRTSRSAPEPEEAGEEVAEEEPDDRSVEAFLEEAAVEYAKSLAREAGMEAEAESSDEIEGEGDTTPPASEIDIKDAIVEEKLIRAIHEEESVDEPVEVTGPRIRVGSLQIQFATDSKLRRVVDDESPFRAAAETPALQSDRVYDAPGTIDEPVMADRSRAEADLPVAGEALDSVPEPRLEPELEEKPLRDGSASVRERRSRSELAVRRRVRRRRTPGSDTERKAAPAEATSGPAEPPPPPPRLPARTGQPTITELLQEGQDIMVQIAKEPIGNKGARVTAHIALPGRFLVYMPTTEHIGVSRRIASPTERARLRRTAGELRTQLSLTGGFIVRTAAESSTEEDLAEDMRYLGRTWNDMRTRSEKVKPPRLVHHDLDLVQRILRDRLSEDFNAIRVDSEEDYAQIVDFVHRFQPKLLNRVKLHTRNTAIFEEYGIQAEIEKAIRPRVWLKSGGYIVINQTEALVAIDVNTGKFVGKTNRFEDTITRTNMEAAKEISRQVRLRDLGGIIVLDFIDMEERKNRQKVMQVLEAELRKDRAPTKILQFNDFGLVAITRKRVKQSLERTLCEPCTHCTGAGLVKSAQTICYEILDEARRLSKEIEAGSEVILRVHPQVGIALRDRFGRVLEAIESYLGRSVTIKSDPILHQEQFDIVTT
ncbi:MAG: Rne/Rng family ribonuclease [Acidobacteria bacterium]|nr:Rne/Rng family ribonuclease [Acidobacteriota bacterium]